MNRLFILTATVGLLMSSISVQAQQRGNKGKDNQTESTQTDRGEKQRDGQGKEGGGSGLFQLLDVDGDGNLSEKGDPWCSRRVDEVGRKQRRHS